VADHHSVLDRRVGSERRHHADRRKPPDKEALLSELERRIAAALHERSSELEGNGSGWDKLIVSFA
jgi:hypothetical protein